MQIALEVNDTAPQAARKRAMELLDYLGVGRRANNLPVALSGGEQQRVAVARALANDPSLILADEPTAALDSQRGRQVMELFAKIAHEHQAGVIVVTHDHRTLDVFDRILDMEDGRLRPAARLRTQPDRPVPRQSNSPPETNEHHLPAPPTSAWQRQQKHFDRGGEGEQTH